MTLLDQGLGSHADAPHIGRESPVRSVGAEVLPLATSVDARRGTRPRCVNPDVLLASRGSVSNSNLCSSLLENGAMKRLNGIPADGALGQAEEFPI